MVLAYRVCGNLSDHAFGILALFMGSPTTSESS